ncbi:cyclin-dependent kinase F-3-like [Argentina anserina]|uniref:cyclin-dependent kinase F-3-like n=1 Tax=Argentina anserina TaxID=57926 RepID=UPI00217659F3|nr:cyclin-dependent kinase F-3-like [Potentilla anserina]
MASYRYHLIQVIGEGSFGVVYKAIDNHTGQFVAIKQLKQKSDPKANQMDSMEVRALSILQHPNIVRLQGGWHQGKTDFLVFEYMQGSLGDLIHQRLSMGVPFSEAEIRSLMIQVLGGLEFMHHKHGFMHRDLKPANLLMNKGVIKISDLGTATEIGSLQAFHHYVTTRSYRAPEMLLGVFKKTQKGQPFVYDEKVDMWAVGAIMAELYLMRPLFRGHTSPHQLHEICKVIGAPTWGSWMAGMLATKCMIMPNKVLEPQYGRGFRALMPYASQSAINLIESLCSWNPARRPSAAQALQHPFFKRVQKLEAPPGFSNCTHRRNSVVPKLEAPPGFPNCTHRRNTAVPKMTYLSTMQHPVLGL